MALLSLVLESKVRRERFCSYLGSWRVDGSAFIGGCGAGRIVEALLAVGGLLDEWQKHFRRVAKSWGCSESTFDGSPGVGQRPKALLPSFLEQEMQQKRRFSL